MASKKTVEVQEYEMTYEELVTAFLLLRPLGLERLPVKAALKVRKLHHSLKPDVVIRDEQHSKILEENGAEKEENGSWKEEEDGGEIRFKTKRGRTKALKQLEELAEFKVKISMIPLEEKDLSNATGLTIQPSLLIALEESKLLVLDDS